MPAKRIVIIYRRVWPGLFMRRSNTDEKAPVFELVPGRTEQSNKLNTFRLESEGNTAHIRLSRHMDYESISEYILNIRIQVKRLCCLHIIIFRCAL